MRLKTNKEIQEFRESVCLHNNAFFILNAKVKLKEIILFACPYIDTDKLVVLRPPKFINADISTNLPQIYGSWKDNEFYKDFDELLEALDILVPAKEMKVEKGFLNITFEDEPKYYILENMVRHKKTGVREIEY